MPQRQLHGMASDDTAPEHQIVVGSAGSAYGGGTALQGGSQSAGVVAFHRRVWYACVVLALLLLTYLFNQADRYAFAIAANSMKADLNFNGVEYSLLAGPVFVAVYSVTGIFTGYLADRHRRTWLLATLLAGWSAVTLLVGFAGTFWQVALLRACQGLCEAGCTPLANGLIGDYFKPAHRGAALGVYNWGIYMGYGAAYGIGNVIAHNWGWRAMFKLFGIPGMVLAVFVATLHEPKRGRLETETETEAEKNDPASPTMEADASRCGLRHGNATCDPPESTLASSAAAVRGPHDSNTPSAVYSSSSAVASQPPPQQARQSRKQQQQQQQHALLPVLSETAEACTAPAKKEKKKEPRKAKRRTRSTSRPASAADIARYWCGAKSLLLLCVAGAVRNAGGYVWAYNTNLFFENVRHQTAAQIATYLGWVPLLGGSIGALVGGAISDRVVKRGTVTGRLWVLVISQACAAPFAAGALFLPVPWAYLSLLPGTIIGEMWVALAVYFFVIANIGGNSPILVPVLAKYLGDQLSERTREQLVSAEAGTDAAEPLMGSRHGTGDR